MHYQRCVPRNRDVLLHSDNAVVRSTTFVQQFGKQVRQDVMFVFLVP